MATRAIVTSHPVVACDVCGRRLLRGENPDVFVAGGQRRMVCELCIPRAAAEGWLREADDHSASVRPTSSRRGGSLLERLRQLREPARRPPRHKRPPVLDASGDARDGGLRERELYDFLDAGSIGRAEPYEQELYIDSVDASERGAGERGERAAGGAQDEPSDCDRDLAEPSTLSAALPTRATPTSGELRIKRALEVFNASEQPRRVAGVARSLGAPAVTVRPLQESGSIVTIVVAWELCWYRYEVDLGDEAAGARQVAQGMELDELPAEDRLANAAADERGELSVLG